ncbi:MAG: Bax inhibitor-1/YccA family protein [Paraglaciecola sp.]|uniref:Bax inhibitor-1/YccA family protein n=1 Tax=Paraglaciecola sp. TaxID=1920173 RepID=UPI00273D2349|nr:Bax inhibitor-1/YccA family protein [Paraglaciecola sp.]MDP5028874.1 Bax inhibitor-1/YccA family protein [Paraglaciecola sp.]MDP5129765.1 Bax inhibitor-1/YccA family protein [Paraglaciecola sp.]
MSSQMQFSHTATGRVEVGSVNKVLRNTYALLAMTLLFSGLTASLAVVLNMPPLGLLLTLGGYFGLLFLTHKTQNSAAGLLSVFALTGFMGLTLGPLLSAYWAGAPTVVIKAAVTTAVVFVGLSAYAVFSKRDFSFLRSFLVVGIIVGFILGLTAFFMESSALSLAVSAMFVLLMSGLILYETNNIIKGGETNYIMATVSLFVAIFNLFTSLLHLLGASGDSE